MYTTSFYFQKKIIFIIAYQLTASTTNHNLSPSVVRVLTLGFTQTAVSYHPFYFTHNFSFLSLLYNVVIIPLTSRQIYDTLVFSARLF